jgi:hypothetical protein
MLLQIHVHFTTPHSGSYGPVEKQRRRLQQEQQSSVTRNPAAFQEEFALQSENKIRCVPVKRPNQVCKQRCVPQTPSCRCFSFSCVSYPRSTMHEIAASGGMWGRFCITAHMYKWGEDAMSILCPWTTSAAKPVKYLDTTLVLIHDSLGHFRI